ncbi:iduronate 2-sulfatase-like [Asterias amurensis]|uniref:iduronate 2-sulfatase-like n=1 Tax=Asterias amurensis TaxID=7602 RepID=UPI003AB8F1C2
MMMFLFTLLLCLVKVKVIISIQLQQQFNKGGKPNVLFLVIDDFRPALGSYGERVHTPNMDQLAAQSIRFTDARAQQAVCAPSRISFLTGRRPDSTLLWDFRSSYWRQSAGNYTTIPQHFKDNGYYTLSAGKVFHHGPCSNNTDDYPYSWSVPCYWPTREHKTSKVCPGPDGKLHAYTMCPVNVTEQPGGTLPDIDSTNYAISALHDLAAVKDEKNLLMHHKGNKPSVINPALHTPFFMAVGYHKPHLPFRYPEEYKSLYPLHTMKMAPNPNYTKDLPPVAWEHWRDVRVGEDIPVQKEKDYYGPMPPKYHLLMRQAYFAATSYIDHEIGRLLSTLEQVGFANNTIIALTGDHGWQLGEHQEWSKYSNYDSATQVPLMFYIPQVTNKRWNHPHRFSLINPLNTITDFNTSCATSGFASDAFAELVDLFPTLSEIAGLTVPPVCPIDTFHTQFCSEGVSLAPVIHNITDTPSKVGIIRWKNASFSQYPRPTFYPSHKTNTPQLPEINIMGYSMHTKDYRYVEWLPFNHTTFAVNWLKPLAVELYSYREDPLEMQNVYNHTAYQNVVKDLARQLRQNWRHALPITHNGTHP